MIAVCESVEANQLFKPLLKTLRDCADRHIHVFGFC